MGDLFEVLRLVVNDSDRVGQWVFENLGQILVPPFVAIGIVNNDTIVGGWVINDFNSFNCEVTIYGPGCVKRNVIRALFSHVFIDLGCIRLSARTRRDNHVMRRILPRLGFKQEAVAQRYFGPNKRDDAFVYRMLRHECQWIEQGK